MLTSNGRNAMGGLNPSRYYPSRPSIILDSFDRQELFIFYYDTIPDYASQYLPIMGRSIYSPGFCWRRSEE